MASGSDLFCDTVFQNYFLHAKASLYTHKRNHFTQFTFIHHLSIKQSFFSELATAGFSIFITVKRVLNDSSLDV